MIYNNFEVNTYQSKLNDIYASVRDGYTELWKNSHAGILDDYFYLKFESSWESEMTNCFNHIRLLVDFLEIANLLVELSQAVDTINKYRNVYNLQQLMVMIDNFCVETEADKYLKAKENEKDIRQKLQRLGVPQEWLNKRFSAIDLSKGRTIPNRGKNETISQYLKRTLRCSGADFEDMLKVYKAVISHEDRQRYDFLKVLVSEMRMKGINRTPNQLYDILGEDD